MFIVNNKIVVRSVKTNQFLGNYLVKKGFVLLQRQGKLMIFSETVPLLTYLTNLPWHVKKWGKVIE